ncbi:WD40-repeat-containing domain protein [Lipomyces oligophaga]|uniref:WD40-repeat-containing domain protein n=1 Tax=Lipomyces oligophaga TaxID=45792 RepID=UPI0034CF4C0C
MLKFSVDSTIHTNNVSIFYYVTFYPFRKKNEPQIFATVGDTFTLICSCEHNPQDRAEKLKILATYDDDNDEESLCSVAWTQNPSTGAPWLAVGGKSGIIKIIDCITGQLVRSLAGHGDEILDLQVSPTLPYVLGSSSGDHTIRVWNLDERWTSQPCAVICAGEGHREQVLSIAFHRSGRFIISGGMDNQLHLWALPDLSKMIVDKDEPLVLHWSHFTTNVLHSNYVDSVAFYGDLILSKAAKENKIVLWRVDGFDSELADLLSQENAPTSHDRTKDTRSAFGSGFTRLVQFSIFNTAPWYMRFGLSNCLHHSAPMLVMGNDSAKVYVFDLKSLELHHHGENSEDEVVSDSDSESDLGQTETLLSGKQIGIESGAIITADLMSTVDCEMEEYHEVEDEDELQILSLSTKFNSEFDSDADYLTFGTVSDTRSTRRKLRNSRLVLSPKLKASNFNQPSPQKSLPTTRQQKIINSDLNEQDAFSLDPVVKTENINLSRPQKTNYSDLDQVSASELGESELTSSSYPQTQTTTMTRNSQLLGRQLEPPFQIKMGLSTITSPLAPSNEDLDEPGMAEISVVKTESTSSFRTSASSGKTYDQRQLSHHQLAFPESIPKSASELQAFLRFRKTSLESSSTATRRRHNTVNQSSSPSYLPSLSPTSSAAYATVTTTRQIFDGSSIIADPFVYVKPQTTLEIPKSKKLIRHLAFSPHKDFLVAVGDGGIICVWSVYS